jgi:hypothetical protein
MKHASAQATNFHAVLYLFQFSFQNHFSDSCMVFLIKRQARDCANKTEAHLHGMKTGELENAPCSN